MLKKLGYVLCVLLAAALAVLFLHYRSSASASARQIQALQEQARPYEVELDRLMREVDTRKREIATPTEPGMAVIGYTVSSASDLALIATQSEQYGFQPVIFLPVDSAELEAITAVMYGADYEIALTYDNWDGATVQRAQELRKTLESNRLHDVGAFLLRSGEDTPENRQALQEAGFRYLVVYGDRLDNQFRNDVSYLNYSYISRESYTPDNRLSALVSSEQAMCFVFSMQRVGESGVVAATLDRIRQVVDQGQVEWEMLTTAAEKAQGYIEQREQEEKAYDREEAEIARRIDELQRTIDEIYSHWNDSDSAS